MENTNKRSLYVIFEFALPSLKPGIRYIARDGTMTEQKSRAATFGTASEAKAFATEKGIIFDGAMRYIGKEDFTDEELQGH